MKWVTFAEFIELIKNAKRWEMEVYNDGIVLTVQEAEGFQRKKYHSPDPIKCEPEEWGQFLNSVANELEKKEEVY
jgi:hypothetical protein